MALRANHIRVIQFPIMYVQFTNDYFMHIRACKSCLTNPRVMYRVRALRLDIICNPDDYNVIPYNRLANAINLNHNVNPLAWQRS